MLLWLSRLFIGLFAGLVLLGMTQLVFRSLGMAGNNLQGSAYHALLAEPGIWRAMSLSLFSALTSTALSVLACALLLAGAEGGWRHSLMERVSRIILAVPHAAFAFGLFLFLTPGGWAVRLVEALTGLFPEPPAIASVNDSFGLVLTAALVLKETPFLILLALPALARLKQEQHIPAARALGHARHWSFFAVAWPRLYREIRLPVLAVLVYGIGVVDMAQIVGPTTPPTLAVLVTRLMSAGGANGFAMGEAGAVLLIGVGLLAVVVWLLLEILAGAMVRKVYGTGWRGSGISGAVTTISATLLFVLGGAALAALATLAVSAFAGSWPFPALLPLRYTVSGWQQPMLFGPILHDTLLIAAISALIGLFAVLIILESRGHDTGRARNGDWVSVIMFAPLLLPQLSLVAGVSSGLSMLGLGYGLTAVIFAHLLYTVPYIWLSFSPSHAQLDPRYAEAAAALGKGHGETFLKIRLPILLTSLCIALAIGASVSFAQYLPTLIAGGGRIATVTTEAVALASGGERRPIAVLGLTHAALPAMGFMLAAIVPILIRRGFGWIGP